MPDDAFGYTTEQHTYTTMIEYTQFWLYVSLLFAGAKSGAGICCLYWCEKPLSGGHFHGQFLLLPDHCLCLPCCYNGPHCNPPRNDHQEGNEIRPSAQHLLAYFCHRVSQCILEPCNECKYIILSTLEEATMVPPFTVVKKPISTFDTVTNNYNTILFYRPTLIGCPLVLRNSTLP